MARLIPFAPEHFATLSDWFESEREVVQWGGPALSFPLRDEQLQAMVDEGRGEPPERLCWMAEDDHRNLYGHAQLCFDWCNGNARLARVVVAPQARGRGLATTMLRLIVDEAFARPGIERAELNVYAWNSGAIRTYERLGFTREGIRRSATRVRDGRWDNALMGLLRDEWRQDLAIRA